MSSIIKRSPRKPSRMHEESMNNEIDAETVYLDFYYR